MGLIIEGLRFRRGDILTPASLARILSLRGTSGGGQIIHAATVSQLLPYPFGPAEFGIDLSRYRTL